jgi:hypothetical protein
MTLWVGMTPHWGIAFSWGGFRATVAAWLIAVGACTLSHREWPVPPLAARLIFLVVPVWLVVQFGLAPFAAPTPVTRWENALVAVTALGVVAVTLRTREFTPSIQSSLTAAMALHLSSAGVYFAECMSPHRSEPAQYVMRRAAVAGLLAVLALMMLQVSSGVRTGVNYRTPKRLGLLIVVTMSLFVSGAVLRACAVIGVADPGIDVYTALREAPGHLLKGRNPYSEEYSWPYPWAREQYDRPPFYPPLPIILALPFRSAGLDVRFVNVICDLLAALALFGTGWSRGSPLIGALIAGAYLHFPRVPFMMEEAWNEPMLAAALGWGLLLAERGWRLGYFLIGLGLTGKQYGVALLPPLAMAWRRHWRPLLVGIVLAGAAVMLPFFLWDPKEFLDVVVVQHMRRPNRDSINFQSAINDAYSIAMSREVLLGFAALVIAWITWRTSRGGTACALWMATALLTFCLCHSQAFFNYFYLCEYLFLLGIAALVAEETLSANNTSKMGQLGRLGNP